MAKGDDLEERFVAFAARIVNLSGALPSNPSGKHIANQVLRSGTSPAAHYAEARSAESKKDFAHKLKIGEKELNETKVWLKIIAKSQLLSPVQVGELIDEAEQLGRIFNASIRTARSTSIDH